LAVLRAREIPACAIADLDFAFTEAAKGNDALMIVECFKWLKGLNQ
jgi:hypothetical protein